jgi:hypothetical protein
MVSILPPVKVLDHKCPPLSGGRRTTALSRSPAHVPLVHIGHRPSVDQKVELCNWECRATEDCHLIAALVAESERACKTGNARHAVG